MKGATGNQRKIPEPRMATTTAEFGRLNDWTHVAWKGFRLVGKAEAGEKINEPEMTEENERVRID